MGLTRDLCNLIAETRYESLGADCVDRVREVIKDGLAVALAGCRYPQISLSAEHVRSLGGAPQATVWGWGFKASVVQAAYVNGAATHVLDYEPMWKPSTHALSPTLPVAFALAEERGATGRQLITAVAKGLEIQGRMLLAGNLYTSEKMRFHPPGVVGVLGSAVAASDMLQLGVQKMQHAIGLAASRAGSLVANIGSMTKCTHCGTAAASGLDAALLAKRGFTANPDVIEAPKGFAETFYLGTFEPEEAHTAAHSGSSIREWRSSSSPRNTARTTRSRRASSSRRRCPTSPASLECASCRRSAAISTGRNRATVSKASTASNTPGLCRSMPQVIDVL